MRQHTLEPGTTTEDENDQTLERRLARATRLTLVVNLDAPEDTAEQCMRDRDPVVIRRHPDRWFDRSKSPA